MSIHNSDLPRTRLNEPLPEAHRDDAQHEAAVLVLLTCARLDGWLADKKARGATDETLALGAELLGKFRVLAKEWLT